MLVRNAILASAFAIGSFGCTGVGSVGDNQQPEADAAPIVPTVGEAEAFFNENVAPTMTAGCSGEACHTGGGTFPPKFLGAGGIDMYDTITSFPSVTGGYQPGAASLILTFQPAHPEVDGQTPVYQPGQADLIAQWLQLEYVERGLDQVVPNQDPVMQRFIGCMTLQDWDESQMYRWADYNARTADNENVPCRDCHGYGLAGFNTAADDDTMFQANRYVDFAYGFWTIAVDAATGDEMVVPAWDKLMLKGGNLDIHPDFNVGEGNQYRGYLQDFYDRTLVNMNNNNCGPAQFATPPSL